MRCVATVPAAPTRAAGAGPCSLGATQPRDHDVDHYAVHGRDVIVAASSCWVIRPENRRVISRTGRLVRSLPRVCSQATSDKHPTRKAADQTGPGCAHGLAAVVVRARAQRNVTGRCQHLVPVVASDRLETHGEMAAVQPRWTTSQLAPRAPARWCAPSGASASGGRVGAGTAVRRTPDGCGGGRDVPRRGSRLRSPGLRQPSSSLG